MKWGWPVTVLCIPATSQSVAPLQPMQNRNQTPLCAQMLIGIITTSRIAFFLHLLKASQGGRIMLLLLLLFIIIWPLNNSKMLYPVGPSGFSWSTPCLIHTMLYSLIALSVHAKSSQTCCT
uniref:Uncharacterized protein n=1 Tax=Micrurus spixii TaxID=129469 RepID=A0A2D4N4N3_9SAUR